VKISVGFAIGMMASIMPAIAHHSFAVEYDSKNPVTLAGTVTKVEWMNPHARFYVDTKDENGKIINFEFELGSINFLMRKGWTRNSLKPGDVVTVDGYRAKDGTNLGSARSIKLADGRRVLAGAADDGAPAQ